MQLLKYHIVGPVVSGLDLVVALCCGLVQVPQDRPRLVGAPQGGHDQQRPAPAVGQLAPGPGEGGAAGEGGREQVGGGRGRQRLGGAAGTGRPWGGGGE